MSKELLYNAQKVYDTQDAIVSSGLALATSFMRVMPGIFIAGVQKGGTTSLYDAMVQHPQILPSKTKEMFYYGNLLHYKKGKNYYKQFFATRAFKKQEERKAGAEVFAIDASTDTFDSKEAPVRILADNPAAKIIVMLRDPVQRAFSHYKFSVKKGYENASFEKALELEEQRIADGTQHPLSVKEQNYAYLRLGYKTRGIYAEPMRHWLMKMESKNLHIVNSEEFFENPAQVYNDIMDFLGLKKNKDIKFNKLNETRGGDLNAETKKRLSEFYKPHNEKLFDMIKKRYIW